MKLLKELGRFLDDSALHMRVSLTKDGFLVQLHRRGRPLSVGRAKLFSDAVDEAVLALARQSKGASA